MIPKVKGAEVLEISAYLFAQTELAWVMGIWDVRIGFCTCSLKKMSRAKPSFVPDFFLAMED
jgi:hypothetical protein